MAWLDVYSCVLLMANPQALPSFRRLERKSGLQFRKNTYPGKWELSAGFLCKCSSIYRLQESHDRNTFPNGSLGWITKVKVPTGSVFGKGSTWLQVTS